MSCEKQQPRKLTVEDCDEAAKACMSRIGLIDLSRIGPTSGLRAIKRLQAARERFLQAKRTLELNPMRPSESLGVYPEDISLVFGTAPDSRTE